MNLSFVFQNLRRYGIKGAVDYLLRQKRERALAKFLRRSNRSEAPEPGITLIGPLDQAVGLSKTFRDLAIRLQSAGIPFQTLNVPSDHPIPESEYRHLLTPTDDFVANRYSDVVSMQRTYDVGDPRCRAHAIEFWEFEDGIREAKPEITVIDNLIAMSDFDFEVFRNHAPHAVVRKILYPFQFNHGKLAPVAETRRKYDIPENAFAVFFNFDYQSSYFRKNPEAILRAFRKAFSDDEHATLVFKTMRAKRCAAMSERLHRLARELGIERQLITIDDFIPQEDLVNLTHACDAYISMHRGEGFGLGIAEAMLLGKPVIVTDYASTTEFCNADNALLVPYRLVAVKADEHDIDAYNHVSRWAEPDIDAAAEALRKLYRDYDLRTSLGARAQAFIADYFSVENFRKSVKSFIEN